MRRITMMTLAVAAIALFVGCNDSPPNTDAWLSYKYTTSCGTITYDVHGARTGPCVPIIDNTDSAYVYYLGLGVPDPNNYTFSDWLAGNGFPPDGNSSPYAIYGNLADLQIGREMHCLQNGQKIACFVSNFGTIGGDMTANVEQPFTDFGPFGRVAMVYDPTIVGPNQVSFYAFGTKFGPDVDQLGNPVAHDDALLYDIALDQEGRKTVPRMCMACHGGNYDTGSDTATGAKFLPFDVFSFRFPTDTGYSFDDQQENLRKLNALVVATNPGQPITDLINGMYPNGVNNTGSTAVDGFVPKDWSNFSTLYTGVVRPYCRTCHLAQSGVEFTASDDWAELGPLLNTMICQKHDMPHSQVSFGISGTKYGFWNDRVAQQDMGNFFKQLGINSCLPSD